MSRPSKNELQAKVKFIESQLDEASPLLPDTYEYLLNELDRQRYILAQLMVLEAYKTIESSCA